MLDNTTAATETTDSAGISAIAEIPAEPSGEVAATADDEISRLKDEYRENLLAPDETEADEPDESAETAEQEDTEETEPVAAADPLAPAGPRDLAALKAQFPRTPTTVLEELARVEDGAWKTQEKLTALGGEIGLGIANEVMPLLLTANPTEKDADTLLDHIFNYNSSLGIEASKVLLDKSFELDEIDPATNLPIRVATANAMIKKHLNPNYDLASIEKLIAYDEAGLLDKEELDAAMEDAGESQAVKALKAEVAALKEVKEQDTARAAREAQAEVQRSYERATSHVVGDVMKSLVPLAESYGWTATKEELSSTKPEVRELAESKVAMGEFLTAWMEKELHKLPEWAAVEHLGRQKQAFNDDNNPTHIFTLNSEGAKNKIVASFKEKVRILNKTFAKSFARGNGKQPQKRPVEVPALKTSTEVTTTDPVELAKQAYRREMRQISAQAAG